jgi:hypothetical protein
VETVNGSSQNQPGALSPEAPHTTAQPTPQAAFATFGVAIPAPVGSPAPTPATAAPAPTLVTTAEGVIAAAMKRGAGTPREIAQAEHDTGILFDPYRAQDIADAAAEQAHAEDAAELAERGRQLAAMAGIKRQLDAVMRLVEGRPGTHMISVAEVAAAAEYERTAFDGIPMTLGFTQRVHIPRPDAADQRAYIECVTAHGARASLVLTPEQRLHLWLLLDGDEPDPDPHAPCETDGCGTVDDYDASDPALSGWVRVEVAGLGDHPRWYCSSRCATSAMTRAGDELATADRAAAIDPDQQGHAVPADDVARCVRCGCTDAQACEGGCAWVPNYLVVKLCSACATPAELAAAGWQVAGGES